MQGRGFKGRRIPWIDTLRGLAIFIAVFGNLAAYLMYDHPMWFRIGCAFVAPLFIALSAFLVSYLLESKGYKLSYFLKRGLWLIAAGVVVDTLAWMIIPFTTVDILYLIGLCFLLAFWLNKLKPRVLIVLVVVFFVMAPVLQGILGYTDYPLEYYFNGSLAVEIENPTTIFNHWIVDGWFPMFPWVGFFCFGLVLGKFIKNKGYENISRKTYLLSGIVLMIVGSGIWYLYPGEMIIRDGWSELMFPPTLGHAVTSIGFITFIIPVFISVESWSGWRIFQLLGKAPLFMYMIHIFILSQIYERFFGSDEWTMKLYLLLATIMLTVMILSGWIIELIKGRMTSKPFIFRFLFGG